MYQDMRGDLEPRADFRVLGSRIIGDLSVAEGFLKICLKIIILYSLRYWWFIPCAPLSVVYGWVTGLCAGGNEQGREGFGN